MSLWLLVEFIVAIISPKRLVYMKAVFKSTGSWFVSLQAIIVHEDTSRNGFLMGFWGNMIVWWSTTKSFFLLQYWLPARLHRKWKTVVTSVHLLTNGASNATFRHHLYFLVQLSSLFFQLFSLVYLSWDEGSLVERTQHDHWIRTCQRQHFSFSRT